MDENSQAFQRWDRRRTPPSPVGTAEPVLSQPSLRDLSHSIPAPSVETLGYFRLSLRDRGARPLSQIVVALDILVRSNSLIPTSPSISTRFAPSTWLRTGMSALRSG